MNTPIRVLIADDHLIVREGLRMILDARPDIEIVAEAQDGEAAIRLTEEKQPQVILMDLRMPGLDGLGAIQRIKARWPQTAIVILTTYNEDDLMLRGLRAGAQSYLLKDTDRETLFNTIYAAARGESLIRPDILARILPSTETPTEARNRYRVTLSQRELEVLSQVAIGARNKEIAARLNLTERTVKAHLDSIFNKLGVDSRAAAVAVAIQQGLLPGHATELKKS
ncbi:MAG: response regulator transcription factor [Aggregatilineales bacterium]